jgi:hypothetical protein
MVIRHSGKQRPHGAYHATTYQPIILMNQLFSIAYNTIIDLGKMWNWLSLGKTRLFEGNVYYLLMRRYVDETFVSNMDLDSHVSGVYVDEWDNK